MALWPTAMRVAAAANVVLLVGLSYVWARNYRAVRSKHALALLAFGALLLAENALVLYYFVMHAELTAWMDAQRPLVQSAMMALRVLETGALLFLTWATIE